MQIETDRLLIRSLRLEDENAYIEMAADGSLYEIFGDCNACQQWMRSWLAESIELEKEDNPYKEYLAYAILDKKQNILVGCVGCSFYDDFNQIGITYFVDVKNRRKGYASEAVAAYTQYFFTHYPVSRLIATVRTSNNASCRTVERAGFIMEKTSMYQDIHDEKEEEYHFYAITMNEMKSGQ